MSGSNCPSEPIVPSTQNTETPRTLTPISSSASESSTTIVSEIGPGKRKANKRCHGEEPLWFKKFREESQTRHEERMEIQQKFVTILDKLVEKL